MMMMTLIPAQKSPIAGTEVRITAAQAAVVEDPAAAVMGLDLIEAETEVTVVAIGAVTESAAETEIVAVIEIAEAIITDRAIVMTMITHAAITHAAKIMAEGQTMKVMTIILIHSKAETGAAEIAEAAAQTAGNSTDKLRKMPEYI